MMFRCKRWENDARDQSATDEIALFAQQIAFAVLLMSIEIV